MLGGKSLGYRIQYCWTAFSKIKIIALRQRYNQASDVFSLNELLKY